MAEGYFEETMEKLFEVEPISWIALVVLKGNPNLKASFNKELKIWDFYGKKGEKFTSPNTCKYIDKQLIMYNSDGTSEIVGNFHIS